MKCVYLIFIGFILLLVACNSQKDSAPSFDESAVKNIPYFDDTACSWKCVSKDSIKDVPLSTFDCLSKFNMDLSGVKNKPVCENRTLYIMNYGPVYGYKIVADTSELKCLEDCSVYQKGLMIQTVSNSAISLGTPYKLECSEKYKCRARYKVNNTDLLLFEAHYEAPQATRQFDNFRTLRIDECSGELCKDLYEYTHTRIGGGSIFCHNHTLKFKSSSDVYRNETIEYFDFDCATLKDGKYSTIGEILNAARS